MRYLMSVSGLLYWNTSTSLLTLDVARRFVRDGPGTKKQIIGSVVLYVHEMSLRNTVPWDVHIVCVLPILM